MYKHTVKSRLAQARSQPPPASGTAATTTPTSPKHGLGAGKKFFSHIRHKIEDNLSPKLGGKLYYKGSKHTRSMSALSLQVDGGCIGGKYTPKAVGPPVATPLKMMEQVPPQMSSSICSYVDSDEESHLSLSLSLTQQSLEDEIFAELEKVAHDESKLNEVLQSFDQILSEYPPVESIREMRPSEEVPLPAPPAEFCDRQMLLSKSHSSLSMGRAKRQIYQSPELANSMLLRRSDSTSNANSRYNSLSELNGSRIPVSKHSSLRKRSESFCLDQPLNHRSSKQRTRSMLTLNSGITGRSSIPARNTAPATARATAAVPLKAKASSAAAPLPPKRANSTLERRQVHSRPPGPRRANSTLRATTAHSDELLVKCLAKGHEILRQVENISSAKPKRSSSRGVSKEHSQLARNKKRHQQKLQYANEEKMGKPKLESCKIIPPKLGETSDKNQDLLVKVVQEVKTKPKAKAKTKDSLPLKKPLKQDEERQQEPSSDSDDSGHISNTVLSTSTSTCNSTGSLCESEGDEAEEPSAVKKSNKIAELLQKFEAVAAAAAAVKSNAAHASAPSMIATKVVAQVQAVRCIQTQVEIYPTYTKEVTMRLH
ncbi:uncharacterized protein LOC113567320 [Drosophila persimilis]|uniref:uncharacterized protein LOC113567320 n=1 Tax=Drosophila persimilis TaxID=7234 RepID=UPI000F07861E|nr:uncharacterized protein LOC113567320 [Drosophila persimilis]